MGIYLYMTKLIVVHYGIYALAHLAQYRRPPICMVSCIRDSKILPSMAQMTYLPVTATLLSLSLVSSWLSAVWKCE